jgi:AcrR family transcriptional regulator
MGSRLMSPKRLTRKEQQAHTRKCLMHAAAKVFARRGLEQASVEEVASEAGYTKGAFYANFKSKEELFLAMLDERFAQRIAEIEALVDSELDIEEKARTAGADFMRHIYADPEWQRLFFEFTSYAARNPDFREELLARHRTLRDHIAHAHGKIAEAQGLEPPIPVEQISLITFALAHGIALEAMLEPDAVPDDLFGTALALIFLGARELANLKAAAPAR